MKLNSHSKLVLGLVLGALFGLFFHQFDNEILKSVNTYLLNPIGQIFLRLIFMVVVPLLFSALVLGVNELSTAHGLANVAKKTLFFTFLTSAASVVIGITLVNIFQPGVGLNINPQLIEENSQMLSKIKDNATAAKPIQQIIIDLFTKNPVDSAARALDGEIIAFMIFALFFAVGIGFSTAKGEKNILIEFFERVLAACMKMV